MIKSTFQTILERMGEISDNDILENKQEIVELSIIEALRGNERLFQSLTGKTPGEVLGYYE